MNNYQVLTYIIVVCCLFKNNYVVGDTSQSVNETKNASTSTLTSSTIKAPNVTKVDISQVAEGGKISPDLPPSIPSVDTTHMGREHTIKTNSDDHIEGHMIKVNVNRNNTNISNKTQLPNYEIPEKNDNKKSVPKKGVEMPESMKNMTVTNTTTTTVKPVRKKPTITEPSDDGLSTSNVDLKEKSNKTKSPSEKQIPSIEFVTENQEKKKADYVVPIVCVILSVPLVAIVISVLYKRGAEWWQHRHYRRMDFLIEGMYNN